MRKDGLSIDDIKQFILFLKKFFSVPVCPLHEHNYLMTIEKNIIWNPETCCETTKTMNSFNTKLESKGELGYIRGMNQAIVLDNISNTLKSKCAGTTKSQIVDRFIEWTPQTDVEAISICEALKVHDLRNDVGSPTVVK